jgi:UrcA family protein
MTTTSKNWVRRIVASAAAGVGISAAMAATMAFAQQLEPVQVVEIQLEPVQLQEIQLESKLIPQTAVVQAEREVTITRGDRVGASSKHRGERITLSRHVDYSDLDLTAASDADELRLRIGDAAQDVCRQLQMLYPDAATDVPGYERTNENCVTDAITDATERVGFGVTEEGRGSAD